MTPPLGSFDPSSVPMPPGTAIVTRFPATHEGRIIPAGAVGRIVSSETDGVRVRLVGVGELLLQRSDIVPRNQEDVVRARVAEAAATALLPCVVLESVVGSQAWGLAGEDSDEDRRGVFVLPLPWTAGLGEPPRDVATPDATSAHWDVRKAVQLGLRADPGMLEMLFVDSCEARDEMGEWLHAARQVFVSRAIYGSFGRYALSQLERLRHGQALIADCEAALAWLRADPDLTLDATALLMAGGSGSGARPGARGVAAAKERLKQLARALHDQGHVTERSFSALKELAASERAASVPRRFRPKNAYNLLRLLRAAIDWLTTGEPRLRVEGSFRERLLLIKSGTVPLEEVVAEAEALTPELEEARTRTKLPELPDIAAADAVLRRIHLEAARRWSHQAPGPWGRDAPEAPLIERAAEAAADLPIAPDQNDAS